MERLERLTSRNEDCVSVNGHGLYHLTMTEVVQMADRLAAYEDTGLEPEAVETVKIALAAKHMVDLETLNNTPISRLVELAEADKDGRLTVLPCKVGEKIYYLNGKYIIQVEVVGYKVDETGAWLFIGETYNPETNRAYHCDLETERIGKTVFRTREEAEKALEEREDKKNGKT